MTLWERMTAFNAKMNGLPRKFALIATVLIVCYLVVFLFPLFAPFFVAGVIAWLMEPLVKLLRRIMGKFKFKRAVSTILVTLLVYGVVGFLSILVFRRIISETMALAKSVPDFVSFIRLKSNELMQMLSDSYQGYLPDNISQLINTSINELAKTLTNFAKTVTSGAFATAFTLPEILLTIMLTIMGTFYLSYDKERIFGFFKRIFPKQVVEGAVSLKNNLLIAVFGQVKSQMLVSLLITITVSVGMIIMQRPYAVLMGLIIGIGDALPVIGAGLFLITWAIVAFVMGDTTIGIGMLVLYLLTILVRQISEPRIVGKNLGLYPLATMMSLYAGFKLMGFIGMLAGPVVLNVIKVVLAADEGLLKPVKKG